MKVAAATMAGLVWLQLGAAEAQTAQYPTLEEFNNVLTVCAAGAHISLTGEIRGNFESVYKDKVVDAKGAAFITSTDFLKSLPEKDRLEGFKLYQTCVVGIMSGTITKASPRPQTNNVDLPNGVETFGKAYELKARALTANTEIRSFPAGSRGENGPQGANGNSGSNGAEGQGGRGVDGVAGAAGGDGRDGASPGTIRIEADSFTGFLRVDNSGQAAGTGGSGGAGGRGGTGGRGTDSRNGVVDCRAGPGNGGQGGNAGAGGDGGRGGNGGAGGAVVLKFASVSPGSTINITSKGGAGGSPGEPGPAGAAGPGGPRGNTGGKCGGGGRGPGASGAEASAGRKLSGGQTGADGSIELTVGDQTITATGQLTKKF
ncbi:MAG: hypothetical protein QHD01_02820 [Bradyrhizobium sp.]|uniref:hypothetical protein n=1 Tax=Bradyrhizobium sp. TaxID=376 RepID=UPI0029B64E48|nr:hypothetical protein [Bradyrhizobium sp.]MDX3965517.1 hypothetical protein [Bradyrhizobium sp.]